MKNAFKRLWNDKRGNALILLGAALPMLVASAGLATDTIQWALWKRQLQRAADSAAIAGVYTRIKTNTQVAVDAGVNADLAMNNHVGIAFMTNYPDIDLIADSGDFRSQVEVTLAVTKQLPFSSMFMTASPTILTRARAASVPGADEFCVLATDPSVAVIGLEITGSSYLDLGDCSLMANSTNPTQAASNGNSGGGNSGSGSTVKAASLAAAGGVKFSNSWDVDDYDPNSPPIADPFASLPVPACTKNVSVDMTRNQTYPMDRTTGTHMDTAGDVVCFNGAGASKLGLKIQGALKLQTGVTYLINGGNLEMNSTGSSLSCTGCTLVMTKIGDAANTGNIKLTGGTISMTAPTTGTYKGVVLYQDRRASDAGTGGQNHINGNSGASLVGAVYIGNRSLLYNGGSQTNAACMQIVSKRVSFSGSSAFKMASACPLSGLTPMGGGRRVRLVA